MPIRIAHISDLHYGRDFDVPLWRSVTQSITEFKPQLIVVTGDLVDHPLRDSLERAKVELTTLAQNANAQLFVVPGNHDVHHFGLRAHRRRRTHFDEVFSSIQPPLTAVAGNAGPVAAPVADPNVAAGFTEPARFNSPWKSMFNDFLVWCGIQGRSVALNFQKLPSNTDQPATRRPGEIPVLLALIDSNAASRRIGFATGSVDRRDLVALDRELKGISEPHLVRIALVHHHLLPIAYTAADFIGAEPLMVLHNAGDVLNVLARHRFDLVLHGHKHKPQFARIDFAPESSEGYPIAVAAAGSAAAIAPNDPRANNFNLITVHDNGQIVVRCLYYGALGPNLNGVGGDVKTYSETFDITKRRAFIRSLQRHPVACSRHEASFEVTEHGDLSIARGVGDLRLLHGAALTGPRQHELAMPAHGRLVDYKLEDRDVRNGYAINRANPSTGPAVFVTLPHAIGDGQTVSYTVKQACANCMVMTQWEAGERSKNKRPRPSNWDEEWVGTSIVHPAEELVLNLKLPDSLAAVQPYLRCLRQTGYPSYPINEHGDAVVTPATAYDVDLNMAREEEINLKYDNESKQWQFKTRRPFVGYRYQLRWRTPGVAPSPLLEGETKNARQSLLDIGARVLAGAPGSLEREALRLLRLLAAELLNQLGSGSRGEKASTSLFAYDSAKLEVRQVLNDWSWSPAPTNTPFAMPLGAGLAGAAFQQRRIVPWSDGPDQSFIRPVAYPSTSDPVPDFKTMLAIPIYHPRAQDDVRPSPWAAIGVITFASTSHAAKIADLHDKLLVDEEKKLVRLVRGLSQAVVHQILKLDGVNYENWTLATP